jgi:hypothetical protein
MVVIRGRVDTDGANGKNTGVRAFFGRGRWRLEYTVRDKDGSRIGRGAFKAQRDGCFALALDAPTPRIVEIRVMGTAAQTGDYCKVDVLTDNDIINLPRRLNPN